MRTTSPPLKEIEINTNEFLIDKDWYPQHLNKYEKQRSKDLQTCTHEVWSKKCAVCQRIVSSEMTDAEHLDYMQLRQDYAILESTIITFLYG